MLPFLKNKQEGAVAGPVEIEVRDHDESFDMLDAVVSDLMAGLENKDKNMVKSALQSLCEHMKDEDQQQDEGLLNDNQ